MSIFYPPAATRYAVASAALRLRHQDRKGPDRALVFSGAVSATNLGSEMSRVRTGTRGDLIATFITIGYGDRGGYDRAEPDVRDAAHEHDVRLRSERVLIGVAGAPVQVRNHDGAGVQTESGAFLRSSLPVAGFAVIEAASINEAVKIASKTPCAVAHGVVEVWPLEKTP